MELLTARAARVREARQLQLGKHRRARGLLLAEGAQAVSEAVAAGLAVEVFAGPEPDSGLQTLLGAARAAGIAVHLVDPSAIAALTSARTPQGLVAVCRWRPGALADVMAVPAQGQVVLAHEMSDPGNAGALIRVADAAGARAVALSERSVDPTNGKCVRATTGSLFHLPVVSAGPTLAAVSDLRAAGYRLLAADVTEQAVDLFHAETAGSLVGPVAWVFGNEAHGLPDEVLDAVDQVVRIPVLGRAESLNLATAAAVCLYAYARLQALDPVAGIWPPSAARHAGTA